MASEKPKLPYLAQVEFKIDGLYIDGVKIPGVILRKSVIMQPGPDDRIHPEERLSDHWTIDVTIATGTPPILEDPIVRDPETGHVHDSLSRDGIRLAD